MNNLVLKHLYVSEHFLNVETTELLILPVNRSVLFLKEKDVLGKSDALRVAIDSDTQIYEDAIAKGRNCLTLVNRQRKQFTLVAKLYEVENLLNTL